MSITIGRYEIIETIGQGGFAIVHRAHDLQLDREVALKELRPGLLHDTGWVRRFQREARAIARLDHPGIVPIYDVYEAENRLFIVMRLVNGPSLDGLISAQRRLPWATAIQFMEQIADGLDYAHNQGILHRDLKPANILIDADRGPLLTDFGLAKLAGEHSVSMSAGSSIVGTPHYIAPEVWEGKGSTTQSDIYALGCILFEMLTGEKVFKGQTPPVVMMAHFQPLELPAVWPPDVPAGLDAVLKKALATNPAARYASATELAQALKNLAAPATPAQTAPPPAEAVKQRLAAETPPAPPPAAMAPEPEPEMFASMPAYTGEISAAPTPPELPAADSSTEWRGFLAHLGPYVIIIGGLGLLNAITDPGGYPWFLWPAIGWGIGLAFHLWNVIAAKLRLTDKWKDFLNHLASYGIIIGALMLMNGLTGDSWFIWPAAIWGVAVGIHFWNTLLTSDAKYAAKRASKEEWKQWKKELKNQKRREVKSRVTAKMNAAAPRELVNNSLQEHLAKARAYKTQIDAVVQANSNKSLQMYLRDLATQVQSWVQSIEELAQRVDAFERNSLIHHDLESVPVSIKKLEDQLAQETDPATRTDLERTLQNRKNQLAALQKLQNTMKRAEIKIERTLSALGTIYPQLLTGQSTNQVADYSRITSEVSEEIRTLRDHLDALEEVKFGQVS